MEPLESPGNTPNKAVLGLRPRVSSACLIGRQRLAGFVFTGFERQIGLLRPEYGRLGARVQEACGFQFLLTWQVVEGWQSEMLEEECQADPGYEAWQLIYELFGRQKPRMHWHRTLRVLFSK